MYDCPSAETQGLHRATVRAVLYDTYMTTDARPREPTSYIHTVNKVYSVAGLNSHHRVRF